MADNVIHLRASGEPTKPNRSVSQLAAHLKLSFAPSDLPLTMVSLARRVEELEHRIAVLQYQSRRPLWKRAVDRLRGGNDEKI